MSSLTEQTTPSFFSWLPSMPYLYGKTPEMNNSGFMNVFQEYTGCHIK
jgi:hypothetical protein